MKGIAITTIIFVVLVATLAISIATYQMNNPNSGLSLGSIFNGVTTAPLQCHNITVSACTFPGTQSSLQDFCNAFQNQSSCQKNGCEWLSTTSCAFSATGGGLLCRNSTTGVLTPCSLSSITSTFPFSCCPPCKSDIACIECPLSVLPCKQPSSCICPAGYTLYQKLAYNFCVPNCRFDPTNPCNDATIPAQCGTTTTSSTVTTTVSGTTSTTLSTTTTTIACNCPSGYNHYGNVCVPSCYNDPHPCLNTLPTSC